MQTEAVKLEVLKSGEASFRKQLRLECEERAHVGTFILVVDRDTGTLWSLIGLSSG